MDGLRDIIYPKVCLACKAKLSHTSIDNIICQGCWGKIKKNLPPFCSRCGRHIDKPNIVKNICPSCIKTNPHFDRAFSPCLYEGALKELIHEFKYKGKDYLGVSLSRPMVDFIKEYNLPMQYIDFIIPVPLHKTRLREREFNQAELLGGCIAKEFKKDILSDTLQRHRFTRTQTELDNHQRLLNVKESFSVTRKQDIKNKNILLVDDVLTTGATASWAAHALKDAGSNLVFVLTLAN